MKTPAVIESEKSLIGSMLISPDMIESVLEQVEVAAIYDSVNKAVYQTISDLYDDNVPIDIVSVTENCTNENATLRVSECMSDVATVTNPVNLINIINKTFAKRYAITLANNIIVQSESDTDIGNIANTVETLSNQMEDFCNQVGVKRRKRGRLVSVAENKEAVNNFFIEGIERQGIGFKDWPNLAKYYRMVKGTINLIGGIPSHGKTTFSDAMVVNSILEHGWKWAIFSPENKPYYLHIQPLSEKLIGKPFFNKGAMSRGELDKAVNFLDSHIKFMEPDEDNTSHDAIHKLMKEAVKSGVDGILIDPWNKLDIQTKRNENRTDAIGRYIKKYQMFSRQHLVYIGLVVHPTKMYKLPGAKAYQVPTLYDCEGSAHWYNGVDMGITFYRNFDTDHCEVHIQKVKFKNHGKMGKVFMRYNPANTRLYEISHDEIKEPKEKPVVWQNEA